MNNKIALLLLLFSSIAQAQNEDTADLSNSANRALKATEFAIPSSPAFNMLNNNTPSRIERYASLHDIKVDWSLTNGQQGYNLSPGIALEIHPVWMLFFDRSAAAKYRRASPLLRTLSTLSISAGTNASNEKNWLAYAAKINLYRAHDPLSDKRLLREVEKIGKTKTDSIKLIIKNLNKRKSKLNPRNIREKEPYLALSDSIDLARYGIRVVEHEQGQQLQEARENYINEHWNTSFLDLAVGRLLTYQQTQKTISKTFESISSPGELDSVSFITRHSLKLNREGYGIWLSGGIGLQQWGMISGMARYGKKPSLLTDTIGTQLSFGLNFRYGNRRYNFFAEGFYDREHFPIRPDTETEFRQRLLVFTLGGDWRISHNVMISFGIRQTRDVENDILLLQPLININCLMR